MEKIASPLKPWYHKLWPVKRSELSKIVPLLLLKFFVSITYCLLTNTKDAVVVTADGSGAETIAVIKSSLVFPCSILVAILYSKLTNIFKRSALFYGIITIFSGIILLYAFVLYPNKEAVTPHESATWLLTHLGEGYAHWIAVYANWVHVLFFITAELWGQVVIFLLYWGFANQICSVEEAKRFYTLFIAAGAVAMVAAGPLVTFYDNKYLQLDYVFTLQAVMSHAVFAAIATMATYWWMSRYVVSHAAILEQQIAAKTKLSLTQSVKHIASSKYLFCIAVLVVGCAITINLVEVSWKAQVKNLYPSKHEFQAFMASVNAAIGITTLLLTTFFSANLFRRFGWHFNAQVTPIAFGVTGIVFLLMSHFQKSLTPLASLLNTTPLILVVLFGAFQNVVAKVVKYAFFDPTKEIVYIPLDQESKTKGKAAIDMVGSRMGKAGSSFIQLLLMGLVRTSSILDVTPLLMPLVLAIASGWSYAASYLNTKIKEQEKLD